MSQTNKCQAGKLTRIFLKKKIVLETYWKLYEVAFETHFLYKEEII